MKVKRALKWSAVALLVLLLLALVAVTIAYWSQTNECDRKTDALTNPMKAILHCEYGSPDVLTLAQVEKPVPNDNQLLVRVHAAAVNPLDLIITGPLLLRPI